MGPYIKCFVIYLDFLLNNDIAETKEKQRRRAGRQQLRNCWFSHDVTKFQTSELLILPRFYFHDVLEQLKTNIQTNFHSDWVLGLVIDYA